MAKNNTGYKPDENFVGCYCLQKRGSEGRRGLHCPLSTDEETLRRTFNYAVRGENIVYIEVSRDFVCTEERTNMCSNCPFK